MATPALDKDFLDDARALIAADSVTEHGNLAAVEVIERLCARFGLPARRLPSPDTGDRDANTLVGPVGGTSGEPLLLVTHLDTVDLGPRDRWRTDPFALTVEGDRAFGLGVADVKLDALCKLQAMKRLKDVPFRRPLFFLGTYGEEAGLRGARAFMEAPPLRPFGVLCGEPSELVLCHAHKGYAVVRVRVRRKAEVQFAASPAIVMAWEGRAAHSSTPHLGVNAIDLALDALAPAGVPYAMWIQGGASANTIPARCEAVVYQRPGCGPSIWKETGRPLPPREEWANVTTLLPAVVRVREAWRRSVAALEPRLDGRFEPAEAVASVTRIRSRPNEVEITMDSRLLPAHDPAALLTAFQAEAARLETPEIGVTVDIDRNASGMSVPEDHPFLRACGEALASVGLSPMPRAKPTSTEAGVFARAGIPALVFGPSRSTGNAHTANERAELGQVAKAIDAYEALVRRLCA